MFLQIVSFSMEFSNGFLINYASNVIRGENVFPLAFTSSYACCTGGYLEGATIVSLDYALTKVRISYAGWGNVSVNNYRYCCFGY